MSHVSGVWYTINVDPQLVFLKKNMDSKIYN